MFPKYKIQWRPFPAFQAEILHSNHPGSRGSPDVTDLWNCAALDTPPSLTRHTAIMAPFMGRELIKIGTASLVQYDASFPLHVEGVSPFLRNTRTSDFSPVRVILWAHACPPDGLSFSWNGRRTASVQDSALGPGAEQGCLGKIACGVLVLIPAPILGVGEGNLRHPVTDGVGCSSDQQFHGRGTIKCLLLARLGLANRLDDVFLTLSQSGE